MNLEARVRTPCGRVILVVVLVSALGALVPSVAVAAPAETRAPTAGAALSPTLPPSPQTPWRPDPSTVRTGFTPPRADLSCFSVAPMPAGVTAEQLPSRWDWRAQGKVTPVKNQANCGSCYAFANVAGFESKLLMDGAGVFDLSENNAKECNWMHSGCHGGDGFLLASLWSQTGTVLEACDPYLARDVGACNTSCPYQQTLLNWRLLSAASVPDTNVLKGYVYTYGPIACTLAVADEPAWYAQFSGYDGSYTLYRPGAFQTDHYVLIVGWDDSLLPRGGSVPGAWIVKNSWSSAWGGACGFGSERGFFTIAYGSAGIGSHAGMISEWQPYDAQGGLLLFDEAGAYGITMPNPRATAWELVRFTPPRNGSATRVEFWTLDPMTDVDIYLYDDWDAGRGATSHLLRSVENLRYDTPGYFSVVIPGALPLRASDDVIAVVKFTAAVAEANVPIDRTGPLQQGRTYFSPTGARGTWVDTAATQMGNLGIRLRYTSAPLPTPTATLTPRPTPTHTVTAGPRRNRAYLPIILRGAGR